jgi:outer membrane protein OmpA-like peptidoglycan-associated protein
MTRKPETALIQGELKDRESGRPLSGAVEATTELEGGEVLRKEEEFTDGRFQIEIPRQGKTDLIFSSPGYTFQTITLPDEKAIDDLSLQPLELSLSRVKPGVKITFESIQFRFGSANLEQSSLGTLDRMLAMLRENPSVRIEIAGHTDSIGPEEVNQRLSELRAEAVAHWLIMNGISSTRIKTVGYGASRPVADNATDEGRRKNRRTEVRILQD